MTSINQTIGINEWSKIAKPKEVGGWGPKNIHNFDNLW
jgi:hypothetical protein